MQQPAGKQPESAPESKHIYEKMGQPHDTVFVDPGPTVVMEMLIDASARIDAVDEGGNTNPRKFMCGNQPHHFAHGGKGKEIFSSSSGFRSLILNIKRKLSPLIEEAS